MRLLIPPGYKSCLRICKSAACGAVPLSKSRKPVAALVPHPTAQKFARVVSKSKPNSRARMRMAGESTVTRCYHEGAIIL